MGYHSTLETIIGLVLIVYMITGLIGNILTIVVLLISPRVRNVTAAFIISLSLADCLFCLLVLPWEVSRFLVGSWHLGEGTICTILPLIRYWNVGVSLLSIAMITINRYTLIAHQHIHKKVYKKIPVALMISFCWIFPFCMLLPTLMGKWGSFGFIKTLDTCSIIDENGHSPKKALFAFAFLVPAIIIIVCYSLIFYVIHKSEVRMRSHDVYSSPKFNGTKDDNYSYEQNNGESKRERAEWRVTKMILTIFLAFVLSYLPIAIIKFVDPNAEYNVLHLFGYLLVYISCCINPLIYVIMNRQYRKAYKSILSCKSSRMSAFKRGKIMLKNDEQPNSKVSSDCNERTNATQISEADRNDRLEMSPV